MSLGPREDAAIIAGTKSKGGLPQVIEFSHLWCWQSNKSRAINSAAHQMSRRVRAHLREGCVLQARSSAQRRLD
jgi:hypothetical protein